MIMTNIDSSDICNIFLRPVSNTVAKESTKLTTLLSLFRIYLSCIEISSVINISTSFRINSYCEGKIYEISDILVKKYMTMERLDDRLRILEHFAYIVNGLGVDRYNDFLKKNAKALASASDIKPYHLVLISLCGDLPYEDTSVLSEILPVEEIDVYNIHIALVLCQIFDQLDYKQQIADKFKELAIDSINRKDSATLIRLADDANIIWFEMPQLKELLMHMNAVLESSFKLAIPDRIALSKYILTRQFVDTISQAS